MRGFLLSSLWNDTTRRRRSMRHAAEVLLFWLILLAGCSAVADQMAPRAPNTAVPASSPSLVAQTTGDPQRGAAIFVGDVAITGFVACRGCHSVDPAAGDGIGPNLAGIALRAGSRMPGVPTDDYIRRSILVHDDYVVPGFEAGLARGVVGRDFAEILSAQDVADLTAYLLTLDQTRVAQAPTMPPSSPTPSPTQLAPKVSGDATPLPTLSAPVEPSPGGLSPTLPTSPSPDNRTATAPGSSLSPTPPASPSPDNRTPTAPSPTNAPPTPQGTPDPATASPTAVTPTIPPSPTVATPPTAAMAPTQPPPPATAPVANQDEPLPEELRVFTGCMTCHDQHAQSIVRMPHVRFPRCSACHSGSPSRVGCPTCHSMHRIQAPHGGENPNLPCSHCHADR
jgi:cytochrome c2